MTYLVDANVLSEPTRPAPHPGVVEWLTDHEAELVVDAVVLDSMIAATALHHGLTVPGLRGLSAATA